MSNNNTVIPVPKTIIPAPPIHPLSSFVTIVLDWLWFVLEVPVTISIAALPALLPIIAASGITCFVSVLLVQRYVAHDDWGASIAKGLVMGITAGVPYPVVGTAFGGVLLGWAGVQRIEMSVRKLLQS